MTVTLAQTRLAVRQRADMDGTAASDSFVSDSELNGYINASIGEFNDIVVSKNLDNYLTSSQFTLSTSNNLFTLTSSFYKLAGVDRLLDGDPTSVTANWYDVHKFSFNERNFNNNALASAFYQPFVRYRIIGNNITFLPAQSCAGTYQIWWYPKAPVLVADGDSYDDTQYWWDYVVVDAAIKCLNKEESDVTVLMAQKEGLKERINAMAADRDYGEPEQIGSSAMRGGRGGGYFGF